MASSFPGTGYKRSVGSELESTTATTGMPSLRASATAMCSLLVSITTRTLGSPPISLIPPRARSCLSRSRVRFSSSFLVRPTLSSARLFSISRKRLIELEIVFQFVSMPPSQRWLT